MAKQNVDVGTSASDGNGDDLRVAFTKINENFTELYSGNVQVTSANVLVYSVAGRTGNVVLTVNDVSQAASKSYVNTSIASNLANVTGSITNSINANVAAANAVISNHSARITTLESNAQAQASQINSLVTVKANVSYVDTSINNALGNAAVSVQFAQINANVTAANAAIATKANGSAHTFSGNVRANWLLANVNLEVKDHIIVGPAHNTGETWANPAGLFFGNTALTANLYSGSRYFQINLQNIDPLGSGDFVITADDGTDASNFISMGVAGSNYSDPNYPKVLPHEGYIWHKGGNLLLHTQTDAIKLQTNDTTRVEITNAGVIKLQLGTQIQFSDGSVQSTAFIGNINVAPINANVTAANLAIAALQSNAGTQQTSINTLLSNAATQATTLNTLTTNAATQASELSTLTANAIVQDTLINNLRANITAANANAATQATLISSLQANITAANVRITTIDANLGSQSLSIDNLISNAASQGGILNTLTANAATQATTLNTLSSNAAAQAILISSLDTTVSGHTVNISTLTANAAVQAGNISTLVGNIASIDVTLGTLTTNASSQQASITSLTSNAATQAVTINNLYTQSNALTVNVATIYNMVNVGNASITALDSNLQFTANTLKGAIFSANLQVPTLIANAKIFVGNSIHVGSYPQFNDANIAASFVGNINSKFFIAVQNTNTGSKSEGAIKIIADDGDTTNNYINIGMYGRNFSGNFEQSQLPAFPHDGYFSTVGGNAAIRSTGNVYFNANTSLVRLEKDGAFTLINCGLKFDLNGNSQTIPYIPGQEPFSMANVSNWTSNVSTIPQALNQLAARLKALGG